MPKTTKTLTERAVNAITKPGLHAVGGAKGLYLQVSSTGARSWVMRYTSGEIRYSKNGTQFYARHDVGLGGYPTTSLKQARERAVDIHDQLYRGIDPIEQRKANRAARVAERLKAVTFEQCVDRYLESKSGEMRKRYRQQWTNSLRDYAMPVLGPLVVGDIELSHVLAVLEPVWQSKTETAKRVRARIETVLDYAAVCGLREGENPARWKGHLEMILPKPGKIQTITHFKALSWREVGGFVHQLRQRQDTSSRCLEFIILTGLRSGEVRGVRWDEINFDARVWTVPGERMKTRVPHTVPLSEGALNLLNNIPRLDSPLIFPSPRGGKVLTDVAVANPIKALGYDVTVHGFRSTFRDWMSENTNYPHHVQEMALAHTIANAVERAYRRGDLLEIRARLMAEWSNFIGNKGVNAD